MELDARGAHGQITVSYTAQRFEAIGKLADITCLAANNDHFQTVVMVHMDMGGGDDLMMKTMLQLCYFSWSLCW